MNVNQFFRHLCLASAKLKHELQQSSPTQPQGKRVRSRKRKEIQKLRETIKVLKLKYHSLERSKKYDQTMLKKLQDRIEIISRKMTSMETKKPARKKKAKR
ncbi:hypothetical protein HZB02_00410 [Candidatus Woesearchaeota archaeon]|nr:hypothetical protein [Candidatus Woesearchaeota archaeon]